VLLLTMLFATAPSAVIGGSSSDFSLLTKICTSNGILEVALSESDIDIDDFTLSAHSGHCIFCSVLPSAFEADTNLSYFFARLGTVVFSEDKPAKPLLFLTTHPNQAPPTIF
jgi:hypothetical protein